MRQNFQEKHPTKAQMRFLQLCRQLV